MARCVPNVMNTNNIICVIYLHISVHHYSVEEYRVVEQYITVLDGSDRDNDNNNIIMNCSKRCVQLQQ